MGTRWIIGLASGSGASGIEAALLEVEGAGLEMRVRFLQATHQPYGRELCELIRRAAGPSSCESRYTALLHRLLGETFAAAARQVADRASLSLTRVQVLGLPGQTVWLDADGRFPSALPLGMAAVVAERTGVSIVSDFARGSPPA
jgi:anhydro-N-acetylmuramic acid kinase